MALIWAGLICWTALDMASSGNKAVGSNATVHEDAAGGTYTDEDVAALAESLKEL